MNKAFAASPASSRLSTAEERQQELTAHIDHLRACVRCPKMLRPPVAGFPVLSRTLLVGQAPGRHEPELGRPFCLDRRADAL